jgi:endonuclease/exonuclease/phosphatase family metal-dependent hydrolase
MHRIWAIPVWVVWLATHLVAARCEAVQVDRQSDAEFAGTPQRSPVRVRFATFNAALHRATAGALRDEVRGRKSPSIAAIAEVLQRVRPDVLLLNEFDFDPTGEAIEGFRRHFLQVAQNGQTPIDYEHQFAGEVNTGLDSQLDLNGDGQTGTPEDAYGYGAFPGQYGMVLFSRFPIRDEIRTFQTFRWRDMPGARWPRNPNGGECFYPKEICAVFRLSSKSHWDVPVSIGDRIIHVIAAHPTPPVFDGPEDRNGCRNHDEIRFIADYLCGCEYIYDDRGTRGGLPADRSFVIMGDLNADPVDGDGLPGSAQQLLEHTRIDGRIIPRSEGGRVASEKGDTVNRRHRGDAAADTADFDDRYAGNLRLDYVLPSTDLNVVGCGVFWPTAEDSASHLADASDHHLVWVDIELPGW